jgi:ABC-type glycerol-3-phosphate transport system substrate-binding protein
MKLRPKTLVWTVLLFTVLVSPCFGGGRSQGSSSNAAAAVAPPGDWEWNVVVAPGQTNKYGWTVPSTPIRFSVFAAGGNDAPTEAWANGRILWKQFLKNSFNVELDYQTTTGNGEEALNLALASGTYADVIRGINRTYLRRFVEQNRVVDLTPYLDTLIPNVKGHIGDDLPMYLHEGKFYGIPLGMGGLFELPDYSAHLRYDEWLEIGSPEIKTPDDYYRAINEVLQRHPTNANGERRYAMSLSESYRNPEDFAGYWGLRLGYDISPTNQWTYFAFTEQGKKMTRWFNQFYRDGTMDPDAFINKYEDWKAKFSAERLVGAVGGWWIGYNAGHEVWQVMDPNTPDTKRVIQIGFKDPAVPTAYVTPKNMVPDSNVIITDKARNAQDILRFVNFVASELGQALSGWGFPGEYPAGNTGKTIHMWNLYPGGRWEFDPVAKQQQIAETWDYSNEGYWSASEIMTLFVDYSRWADGIHCVWANQMWYEENQWKKIMMENMAGTIWDATAYMLRNKTDEAATLETAIKDAREQFWPACVQARTDVEFETAWRNLQNALETAGIHRYEQIRAANYLANSGR